MDSDPVAAVQSADATQTPEGDDRPVIVPARGAVSDRTARIAVALAAATGSELHVLAVDERAVPTNAESDAERSERASASDGDGPLPATVSTGDVGVHATTTTAGTRSVDGIREAVDRSSAGLLVVDEPGPGSLVEAVRGSAARRISRGAACDSVVVSDSRDPPTVASILVPVAEGEHSARAATVAGHVASATDAWVELLHVPTGESGDADVLLDRMATRIPDGVETQRWVRDAGAVDDVVVEQSTYYDLTVIGAPRSNRLSQLVFGSRSNEVRDRAENTVLTVRRGERSLFG